MKRIRMYEDHGGNTCGELPPVPWALGHGCSKTYGHDGPHSTLAPWYNGGYETVEWPREGYHWKKV
jgi:hypothetical protein